MNKNIIIATTTQFHLGRLYREMKAAGEEVDLMTYSINKSLIERNIPVSEVHNLFVRLLPYSALSGFSGLGRLKSYSVEKLLELSDSVIEKCIRNVKYDAFIGLSGMAHKSAIEAKRNGARIYIDRGASHVLYQQKILKDNTSSSLSVNYIERELKSYDVADKIVVPSEHVKSSFLVNGVDEGKVFVNPYGVDIDIYKPIDVERNGRRIVFCGNWSYQKGCDFLDEMVDMDVEILHLGTTKGDVSKSSKVISSGHVDSSRINYEFNRSCALVLPSRQDGFGMVILEALAAGLPVVVSKNTGGVDVKSFLPEKLADKFVIIIEELNQSNLSFAINEAMSNDIAYGDRVDMHDFIENFFSWESYSRRYLGMIHDEM